MNRVRHLTVGSLVLVLCPVLGEAGGGLVALQTAAPSCRDNSGNIYVSCGNGTVTDNRTGLVWLANANCIGTVDWHTATEFAAGLSDLPATSAAAAHDCGLSDGSSPGEWRLASVAEWEAMVADALGSGGDPDCRNATSPTITNDSGGACWSVGPSSFSGVMSSGYWSASADLTFATRAYFIALGENGGFIDFGKTQLEHFWPVRGGQ